MAYAIPGLKVHRKYEDLIGVAVSDELRNIKFPNRDALFLRNGFVLSQLDGEGMRQMELQQEMASKEAYKEHLLKQIAKNTGNIHDLRNDHRQEVQTERVNNAVYYDMSEDDVDDVDIKDDMEGQSSNGSEKRRNNRATEDRHQEITRLQEIHEMEKQALSDSHQANLKSTVDQLRTQLMGEAEMRHAEKEEITRQQVISEINMKETEARNVINQVHQQAQQHAQQQAQEAHNYIGNIVNFAEVKHQNLIAKEKSIKDNAEKKARESNEKQKKAENELHNTVYKQNPSTPDQRAKPKAKIGTSPKKPLPDVPSFPTGEQASGSQEKPKYDNPESEHEPKGKVGRPPGNKKRPAHDVPYDDNKQEKYWMKQNVQYLRVQAFKRGLQPNQTKRSNGKPWLKLQYQVWMKDWLAKKT